MTNQVIPCTTFVHLSITTVTGAVVTRVVSHHNYEIHTPTSPLYLCTHVILIGMTDAGHWSERFEAVDYTVAAI